MPIARPSAAPGEPVERLSGNEETACGERLGGESEQHQHADRPGLGSRIMARANEADGQQMTRRDACFEAQELRRAEREAESAGPAGCRSAAEQQRFRRRIGCSHSANGTIRPMSPMSLAGCVASASSGATAAVEEIVLWPSVGAGQRQTAPSALAA